MFCEDRGAPPIEAATRFIDRNDGTVLDRATGLLWQKGDSGRPISGIPTGQRIRKYAASLTLAGQTWRIPTKREFLGLNLERHHPEVLPFENSGDEYWAGEAITNYGRFLWSENRFDGNLMLLTRRLCRCVAGPL